MLISKENSVNRTASKALSDINLTLLEVAEKGDLEAVKKLIENGADVNAKNENEQTALYCAARGNQLMVVKYLVEKGANINAKEKDGWTILHRAVESNNLDMVVYLVEHEAKLNVKTNYGNTPLDFAIEYTSKGKKEFLAIKEYLEEAALLLQKKLNAKLY